MRIRSPRVIGLEIWDLPVRGRLLQEWRDEPAFAGCLAEAVYALATAPPAAFAPDARRALAMIGHVHVTGGGVTDAIAAALARDFTVTLDPDPFAPARAGCALQRDTACADVGQTAVKVVDGERAWSVARDLVRAPLRDSVATVDRHRVRTSTIAFLGEVLAQTTAARVVVALPCAIGDDEIPWSCTYCWASPDPALVADLARAAAREIAILNDAELAAHAAIPYVPAASGALVLTVGYAVGGALLLP